MRINKGQELVIGGYVPAPKNFDSLIVGYYRGPDLIYVARVRAGFVPALRAKLFERFHKLEIKICPFSNLPQREKGRWGQGLTADKMAECRWLKPQLVAQIEYADWTDINHLRHSKFIALRPEPRYGRMPSLTRRTTLKHWTGWPSSSFSTLSSHSEARVISASARHALYDLSIS
jgi:ATP-dependent DNA ligase